MNKLVYLLNKDVSKSNEDVLNDIRILLKDEYSDVEQFDAEIVDDVMTIIVSDWELTVVIKLDEDSNLIIESDDFFLIYDVATILVDNDDMFSEDSEKRTMFI